MDPRRLLGVTFLLSFWLILQVHAQEVPSGTGHDVSVRIIDAETGKPVEGLGVAIGFLDKNGRPTRTGLLNAQTNTDGVAVFHLPYIPDGIEPVFAPNFFGNCSNVAYPTLEIIKTGVVANNSCTGKTFSHSVPRSGELVIYGKPVTAWRRMMRELF